MGGYKFVPGKMFSGTKSDFSLVLLHCRGKYRTSMTCSILEKKFLRRHISKSRNGNNLEFCMFTSIIRTIISYKFRINLLTLTLFSGSGPKSPPPPPPPRSRGNLKNAVGLIVEVLNDQNVFTKSDLANWFSNYVQFCSGGHFSDRAELLCSVEKLVTLTSRDTSPKACFRTFVT